MRRRMNVAIRGAATCLFAVTACTFVAPRLAGAAAPAVEAPEDPEDPDPSAEPRPTETPASDCLRPQPAVTTEETPEYVTARKLYESGLMHYQTSDYETAIALWQEAAGVLPRETGYRLIKAEVVFNVAQANDKWFEVDRNIKHLRQAKIALENFDEEIPEVYPPDDIAVEREKVRTRIHALESKISQAEQAERERALALAEAGRADVNPELLEREHRRNRAMIGAGAGLTVLGVAGASMMVIGIVEVDRAQSQAASLPSLGDAEAREDALQRGDRGNALIVSGAVLGGAFLAAGIPLLATGAVFERRLNRFEKDYRLGRIDRVGFQAAARGQGGSFVVSGRF